MKQMKKMCPKTYNNKHKTYCTKNVCIWYSLSIWQKFQSVILYNILLSWRKKMHRSIVDDNDDS